MSAAKEIVPEVGLFVRTGRVPIMPRYQLTNEFRVEDDDEAAVAGHRDGVKREGEAG